MQRLRWIYFLMLPILMMSMKSNKAEFDYKAAWKAIQKLEQDSRPKTLLQKVEEIYQAAVEEDNRPQQVKAISYKASYLTQTEEDGLDQAIAFLRSQINEGSEEISALNKIILAEFYRTYLSNNGYRIQDRQYVPGEESKDYKEWSTRTWYDEIRKLYDGALANHNVLDIPLDEYEAILASNDKGEASYDKKTLKEIPNLYTLIGEKAIAGLQNISHYAGADDKLVISDNKYFAPVDDFSKIALDYPASIRAGVLGIYQKMLRPKLNAEAQLRIDLNRLQYVANEANYDERNEDFVKALDALAVKYKDLPESSSIRVKQASQLLSNSDKNRSRALEICRQAISDYPESNGAKEAQNIINRILQPELSLQTEEVYLTGESILFGLKYRNLDKAYAKIVKIDRSETDILNNRGRKEAKKYLDKQAAIHAWSFDLKHRGDYNAMHSEQFAKGLPLGTYALVLSNEDDFDGAFVYAVFHVSNLSYTQVPSDKKQVGIAVMDRLTGAPIANAEVDFYKYEYDYNSRKNVRNKLATVRTDAKGLAYVSSNDRGQVNVVIRKGDDILDIRKYHSGTYDFDGPAQQRIHLMTDRAIYRPGQSVYFKGILTTKDASGESSILANQKVVVTLLDANYQEVSRLDLTTNDFGSVSGQFALSSSGLNGRFVLQTPYGEVAVQVEEYKRPTFEVKIDTLEGNYQLGDEVKVQGSAKTFAGSSIANAQVKYTVYRTMRYPYWGYWRGGNSERIWISNGETTTDDNGNYELSVLLKRDTDNEMANANYIYEVEVDVVDISGEMRSASMSINAGKDPYLVQLDLSDQIDADEFKSIPVRFENYSGKPQAVKGKLTVVKLVEPNTVLRNRYWQELDTTLISDADYMQYLSNYGKPGESNLAQWKEGRKVIDQAFSSNGEEAITLSDALPEGVYKIKIVTDENVTLEKVVTITDFAKGAFPNSQLLFYKWNKKSYQPGETAILELGSAVSAEVLYFVNSRAGRKPVKWIKVNHKNQIAIPITESDRGGVSISIATVNDGRMASYDLFAPVPWTNKELQVTYETIRTDMLPGSDQEWKLKIDGIQSDAMAAEVLVSMYDASLDMFAERSWKHDWFERFYNRYSMNSFGYNAVWGQEANHKWNQVKYLNPERLQYPRLMQLLRQGYYAYAQERMMSNRSDAVMVKKSMPMSAPMADQDMSAGAMVEESAEANATYGTAVVDDGETGSKIQKTFPVRKNLNETVFFFPHLMTDKEGRLVFSFKMNEALTSWKLRTLAHTKALQYAFDEQEVTTSQPIMIFPNKPRFLRQGDEIVMTAKVSNLTKQQQNGQAKIQFIDAITLEDITSQIVQGSNTASFQMVANGSDAVQWTCKVPADLFNSVTYRITAVAGAHTDGEENTVPVLTNKKLITESTPIHVKGGEDKMVIVPNLNTNDGKQPHAYTVEMTSHPAWLAIQALPYLMQSEQKCTEQIVNTYFSNALAHQIATAHPRIQAVFEEWKRKGADAMQSNLSKNEELKYAILSETPWVRQALSEEEQKRNIALLFEMNQMAEQRQQIWQLLQQSQTSNGGFPWFVGGRDNWYITQYILQSLAELQELGVDTDLRADWISRAVKYIDARMVDAYQKLKDSDADMDKDHLSAIAIHYLYVRSMYPQVEKSANAKAAIDYYYSQAAAYWNKRNYYQQGLLGLASLATDRNTEMLNKITISLIENSKTNEELGTYWRLDNGFYWHQLPIASHATLIHFFQKKGGHDELVENAKIWLLKQKQTNHWKTGKSTAAAIHAMLMTPEGGVSDWLLESTPVQVTLGSQRLQAQGAEAGTGYIKQSYSGTEINPAMANIKVSNPNSSVAWGSAYYQYWQSLDKIKLYEDNPLTIDRSIYRIDANDNGTTAAPIKAGDAIQVGDKLKVKLRLKVDRPMEYVHLRDMRATGLEPADVISRYQWSDGLGYYQSTKDVSTDFFISYLPVGTYVLEYELRANLAGDFTSGIAYIQCMYAPEFGAHSEGGRVVVER